MNETKSKILRTAQTLLETGGFGAVSFDTIAKTLGVSKQAILYWFPTKKELLTGMFVDWLHAETTVAQDCLKQASNPKAAIEAFVISISAFHIDNLDRFRMMYLAPQTLKAGAKAAQNTEALEQIHAITSKLYGALAEKLNGEPEQNRKKAFAIHSATLGLVMMHGLADGIGDPLAHSKEELIAAMAAQLAQQNV